MLGRAEAAFSALPLPRGQAEAGLLRLERWLAEAELVWSHQAIEALLDLDPAELFDSFSRQLPFGTGGLRGQVGVGPNRVNPWTVRRAIDGHARWLASRHAAPAVAIAYDVRRFLDQGGRFGGRAGALLGLSSRDLAAQAARVYAAHGVRSYLQREGDDRFLASPELSHAVRALGASGGLYVSASHNPPDDNGLKLYDALGGQVLPPEDEEIAGSVGLEPLQLAPGAARRWIAPLPPALREDYQRHLVARSLGPWRGEPLVFSALHGVGAGTVAEVLERAGFAVHRHPDQCRPDGAFPTVPHRAPNPESPEALDEGVALAARLGVRLVMASDPDADRLGAAALTPTGWVRLSGQAIALLLTDHALRHTSGEGRWIARTAVTTRLVSALARQHGVAVEDHSPVGFKYLGRLIEARGEAGFLLAVEESYGALITPACRDKDAAGAALYLAEAASEARARGETLVDVLERLIAPWGGAGWALRPLALPGAEGRARIAAMMEALRLDPPAAVGGVAVVDLVDLLDNAGPLGPVTSGTAAASRDQLGFVLEGGAAVWIRPSGTEPRAKIYAEALGPGAQERADHLAWALARGALRRVGVALPDWAAVFPARVPVDALQRLARALPEAARRGDPAELLALLPGEGRALALALGRLELGGDALIAALREG
ncbi:MAG: hypothetical protein JXX28_04720 [Deltaproteobacteria bacterium]|nr:hypothetical protein [Deltaproteobacteria bacterium]